MRGSAFFGVRAACARMHARDVCIRTYTLSAQVGHRVHAGGCKRGCACARMHARLCASASVCELAAECTAQSVLCFAQYTHWTQPSSRAQALRADRSRPFRPAPSRPAALSPQCNGRPMPHCTAPHCTAVDLECISHATMGPPLRRSSRVLAAPQSSASLPVPPIPKVECWIWMLVLVRTLVCSVHARCYPCGCGCSCAQPHVDLT